MPIYTLDYKIFACYLQGIFISSLLVGTQFRKGGYFIYVLLKPIFKIHIDYKNCIKLNFLFFKTYFIF